jgi:AraC-like DNA-binding protein
MMQNIAQNIALLLIGFSVFSSVVLAVTHLNCSEYNGKFLSRIAGLILLIGLALLQISHFMFLQGDSGFIYSKFYVILLFSVAPAFYFFSREVLKVDNTYHPALLLHAIPLLIGVFLPRNFALPFAFFIGTGYVFWLAMIVYSLRTQRQRFKLELVALIAMFAVAFLVLLLGVILPLVSDEFFYTTYASLIGLTFVVAVYTVIKFPNISADVTEAAQAAYSVSTLKNMDVNALELRLRKLMEVDKLYVLETLSLSSLSEQMEINTHQLSELINTRFSKSFSQLIREYRVMEAKRMLIDEPKSSVLSIGLSTGFTSQSNFYTAFREMTGMAPGNYRKSVK